MIKVILVTFGLFLGHIAYTSLLSDAGLEWDSVFERTWFQFGAIMCYWLFAEDRK